MWQAANTTENHKVRIYGGVEDLLLARFKAGYLEKGVADAEPKIRQRIFNITSTYARGTLCKDSFKKDGP